MRWQPSIKTCTICESTEFAEQPNGRMAVSEMPSPCHGCQSTQRPGRFVNRRRIDEKGGDGPAILNETETRIYRPPGAAVEAFESKSIYPSTIKKRIDTVLYSSNKPSSVVKSVVN